MSRAGTETISIKGSILRSRLALVDDIAPASRERVLARLEPDERATLASVLPSSWYPFELGRRLDEAIVAVIGDGRSEFFEKLGAASAEKNLAGVHKSFLAPGNPHKFLESAPLVYSYYYDRGRRGYEKTGEREALLTTYDAETFSAPDCLTVVGWYKRALAMCGALKVQVVEEECRAQGGAVCRYRLSWS